MTVNVGDNLPEGSLWEFDNSKGVGSPKKLAVPELINGKKIVIFGLPGAFTPTCSANHLPGYIENAEKILQKVNEIWCLSVNDAFVMNAWAKQNKVGGKLRMFADGNANYTEALGLTLDLMARGMGIRMRRFSMLVDNGIIRKLNIEEPGKFDVSSAEKMLVDLE